MTKQEYTRLDRLPNTLPWVVGLAASVLVVFYALTFKQLPWSESPSAWGSFGDYVGGLLNPLVSTFTLIVAVKVWQLQKHELAKTQTAMADQAKTAEQQRSEQRFFDVLNLYLRTVDALEHEGSHGRSAIESWRMSKLRGANYGDHLAHPISWFFENGLQPANYGTGSKAVSLADLKQAWGKPDIDEFISPYLRVVFRLLTDAEFLFKDANDRRRYMKLFRAQLSANELTLIGLNLWLSDVGHNMRPVAETYGLLKHLPKSHLRTVLELEIPRVFGSSFAAQ